MIALVRKMINKHKELLKVREQIAYHEGLACMLYHANGNDILIADGEWVSERARRVYRMQAKACRQIARSLRRAYGQG